MKLLSNFLFLITACVAEPENVSEISPPLRASSNADHRHAQVEDITVTTCFAGTNTVNVKGKGDIVMQDLAIGDEVLSGDGRSYTRVYSFLHKHDSMETQYLAIHLAGEPKPLEVSPLHYVFQNGNVVAARTIQVGDTLDGFLGKHHLVTAITTVKRHGLYAPATQSGDLLVNGIRASNYVMIANAVSLLDPHAIAHAYMAPLRWWCSSWHDCSDESYTEDGYSFYIAPLLAVVTTFVDTFAAPWMQQCGSLLLGLALSPWWALDWVVLNPCNASLLSILVYLFFMMVTTMAGTTKSI